MPWKVGSLLLRRERQEHRTQRGRQRRPRTRRWQRRPRGCSWRRALQSRQASAGGQPGACVSWAFALMGGFDFLMGSDALVASPAAHCSLGAWAVLPTHRPLVPAMPGELLPLLAPSRLCADNPAQLRRQLQAVVPELTLTQLPVAVPAGGGGGAAGGAASTSRAALQQRPAGVRDRAAAAGLLDRMHRLQAAATELLQEQGVAATCASVATDFRRLLPEAGAAGSSLAAARAPAAELAGRPSPRQAAAAGPSAAAAARLAKLAQLRAAGSELAAALA